VSFIHRKEKYLTTNIGDISYDYLVIATGSTNNFFSFEPTKEELLTLKSVPEALDMRSFIMQNLEQALYTVDEEEHEELINIVIIGGGPAGVELAGALAEMRKYVLPKDFPELDINRMKIYLFEASSDLLSFMSQKASDKTRKYLEKLGVDVQTDTRVKNYMDSKIYLENGSFVPVNTVIWTAGVKGFPIDGLPHDSIVGANRISVNEFNRVDGDESIYAIGDVAFQTAEKYPGGLPMLAPVAVSQGKLLAKNFKRFLNHKEIKAHTYTNKGVMATVGRNRAVADLPGSTLSGALAWMVWMLVHIMSLVGFKNKVVAVVGWTANYFNYDRPLGLIIRPFNKKGSPITDKNL